MAKKKKENRWGEIYGGHAFIIPSDLIRHPNFTRLSPAAHKLLMDVARQYTGYNNGYLCASWALMKDSGWNSPTTLRAAMLELEHYKILTRTKQGGRNQANLHALTWRRIDEPRGSKRVPLDVFPTTAPSNSWLEEQPEFIKASGNRKMSNRHLSVVKSAA